MENIFHPKKWQISLFFSCVLTIFIRNRQNKLKKFPF